MRWDGDGGFEVFDHGRPSLWAPSFWASAWSARGDGFGSGMSHDMADTRIEAQGPSWEAGSGSPFRSWIRAGEY